ncbi:MAG: MBL fold metallo-hydrolase [Chloroflexota bacterium]|nr:MBL fold metallo-hydrolase [Chloroflexota bacterium]
MAVNIHTLSENTAATPGLLAEWGLSILVETDDIVMLLDTGASISVTHNATAMGIDLSRIDKIVLSHGHSDHTGGLQQVITRIRNEVEVIAHPDVWDSKYSSRRSRTGYAYSGIPFQREWLENLGASFTTSAEPVWLSENVLITGEIPMVTEYEELDPGLFVKKHEEYHPDPLLDDRSIVIRSPQGLIVICGCAHRGVINTLRKAQQLTGEDHVYAIVGGIHLFRSSEERLELTIAEFRDMGVERIGVSHCTGLPASARMNLEFGDGFFYNNAGVHLTL